jgi:hypothetical protein
MLKIVSEYCKLLLPFLAALVAGLRLYTETYRGWKLAGSVLSITFLIAIGGFAVYSWLRV